MFLLRSHLLTLSWGSGDSGFSPLLSLRFLSHISFTQLHRCYICIDSTQPSLLSLSQKFCPPLILSFPVPQFSSLSCKPSTGHNCSLKPLDAIFKWGNDFAAVFSATSSPLYLDSWVFLWIFFYIYRLFWPLPQHLSPFILCFFILRHINYFSSLSRPFTAYSQPTISCA